MRHSRFLLIAAALILLIGTRAFGDDAPVKKVRTRRGPAQDPPRFSPPRPPALDQDFEDPAEDELENGDSPNRAQVPPPSSVPPPVVPANNDNHPPQGGGVNGAPKLKFELADGEYYEKGKKRGRSPVAKRTTQSVQSH
jgi:hypothetical protein